MPSSSRTDRFRRIALQGGAWLAILAGSGCGGDPLERNKDIAGWANASSAFGVFVIGYEPLGFADGQVVFEDAACPATSDDGTTATITGNCVDSKNVEWKGSASVVRAPSGARNITLTDFAKIPDPNFAQTTTGTIEITQLAVDRHRFTVDVTQDGGIDTAIIYTGTVVGGYQGPTVWNGSGTIDREGIVINSGQVEAVTVDELRDDTICAGQSVSGTTTLESADHTVVIMYDGQTDCDDRQSARWSRDGKDQGLVEGVSCALARPGGRNSSPENSSLLTGMLLFLAVSLALRHRRSRPSSPGLQEPSL